MKNKDYGEGLDKRMNVLVVDGNSFGLEDAIESFKRLSHNVFRFSHKDIFERKSEDLKKTFLEIIDGKNINLAFSINYYPLISMACKEAGIKYVSIVYDSPHLAVYHYSLINDCNHVYIFDYSMYNELKSGGVNTVYYLPLPVNVERYDKMVCRKVKYENQVSFVGHLYNESHNLYDRLIEKLGSTDNGEYTKGYLDGLVKAQSRVDGYFFTEEMLNEKVLKSMMEAYPYDPGKDSIASSKYVYGSYFLGRKATELARIRLLKKLSEEVELSLYTPNQVPQLPKAVNKGAVEWYNETPQVFFNSKININISLKSIKTGIPFRVIEVMASKGFIITNYQEDLFRHFEPDVDFVYYNDEYDLVNKVKYYLEHDEERDTITMNGYRKVRALCNYVDVIRDILRDIFS